MNAFHALSQSDLDLYFCESIRMRRSGREKRMGMSDMDSAPPAMIISACPDWISAAAFAIATFEEMHASVTVFEGTETGKPAARDASRAMLLVLTASRAAPRRVREARPRNFYPQAAAARRGNSQAHALS